VDKRQGPILEHLQHLALRGPLAEQVRHRHERWRGLHDRRASVRDAEPHRDERHIQHARQLFDVDLAQVREVANSAVRRVLVDVLPDEVIAKDPKRPAKHHSSVSLARRLENDPCPGQVRALSQLWILDRD
jgi:hypothetical protein